MQGWLRFCLIISLSPPPPVEVLCSPQLFLLKILSRRTYCNGYRSRHSHSIRDKSWVGRSKPRRSYRGFFMAMDSPGVPARKAMTQDGLPAPVSPTDRANLVLASQYRSNVRNLSDTRSGSDRSLRQNWLDRVYAVANALAHSSEMYRLRRQINCNRSHH